MTPTNRCHKCGAELAPRESSRLPFSVPDHPFYFWTRQTCSPCGREFAAFLDSLLHSPSTPPTEINRG